VTEKGRHVELARSDLPKGALDAHAAFLTRDLVAVRSAMSDGDTSSLTIVFPPAGPDHEGWRRALAGDLAREYAPRRVNIAAGNPGEGLDNLLAYLRDAHGVTGHYVQSHE